MINGKVVIGDGAQDCTYEQVAEKEYAAWNPKGEEMWQKFKTNRPYSVKEHVSKAPKAGDDAPDGPIFSLDKGGEPSTLLTEAKKLATGANSTVAISFDSLTCPVWRTYGGQDLSDAATKVGFPVLHIYMREAHASDEFDAPPNAAGPMSLAKQIKVHKSQEERRAAALDAKTLISSQVNAKDGVCMWMDGMDDWCEKAYEARPFRMSLLDTTSGKIVLAGGLCPFNIPAKLNAIAANKQGP